MRSPEKACLPAPRKLSAILKGSVLAASLMLASAANASLSFSFDYSANTAGVGFDDPTSGAARKAAMTTAGMKFSDMFGTFFNQNANIVLMATSTDVPLGSMGGTLASAGTFLTYVAGFGGGEVVRNKVISNGTTDLDGATDDGVVDVNWGAGWQLDFNTPAVAGSTYDLYSVLFHEFTHALGFASAIEENGTDILHNGTSTASGGTGTAGIWTKFDQFLTNCSAGSPLIDPATGLTNLAVYNPAIVASVCFQSAEVGSAKMYTPATYAPGSSVSHLDESGSNVMALMKYEIATGPQNARTYNVDEVHILTSLGYTLDAAGAVPEPGSLSLILLALGAVAVARRRKV